MKQSFSIASDRLEAINEFLRRSPNAVLDPLLEVVEKYGGTDRINAQARENGALTSLLERLRKKNSICLFLHQLQFRVMVRKN